MAQTDPSILSPFHESVRATDAAYISPQKLASQLNTTLVGLSGMMHVHRNSFAKPQSEKLQSKLRDVARIIGIAKTLLGSRDRAVYWFRNQPLADYGNQTAWDLVGDGHADASEQQQPHLASGDALSEGADVDECHERCH